MKHLRAVLVMIFVFLVIVVSVQNHAAMSTSVTFRIDLVFFQHETAPMSVYMVAVVGFFIGIIFAGLYGVSERFRLKKQIKIVTKQRDDKDEELNSLRNLAVTSEDVSTPESAQDESNAP
jgi:ATP adenylyltransferase